MNKMPHDKNALKRTGCELLAQWIRANIQAGCMSFYGDKNGLSDEEIQFLESFMGMEADKLEARSLHPMERKEPVIYPEPEWPLGMEYSSSGSYNDDGLY